jgi:geranylgeranyl diphosphate synthase, type I
LTPHEKTLGLVRTRVQAEIDAELARQRQVLAPLGPDVTPVIDVVEALLRGGKRLRAAFCYLGYVAVGGRHEAAALRAATAMELFQAAALLHDDVMDDSDTRRGAPSAHRALAQLHKAAGWGGDADRFGHAGAVLAGDLCLVWTDEILATCGLPADELARARSEYDTMRTQLMGGQFLDVLVSARGWEGLSTAERLAQARQVIRFKSAKYSIEQPLLIGARAGGATQSDLAHLSAYGLDLGEAFQLRDDILGVYGDPGATGKPAGDDLREGKRTMLVGYALDSASPHDAAILTACLGRLDLTAAEIESLRAILTGSGAVQRVEERIDALVTSAAEHLARASGLTSEGAGILEELITITTARSA